MKFQKRGFLQMHLLLILADEDKLRDSEDIVALVLAKLPDSTIDLVLHETLKSSKTTGPVKVSTLTFPA